MVDLSTDNRIRVRQMLKEEQEGKREAVNLDALLNADGPVCLVVEADLEPVGGENRFQPAGFPQIGHVIYDAPQGEDEVEKVCIVDSAASMANHLESVCLSSPRYTILNSELKGLPHVVCVTDDDEKKTKDRVVTSTFKEGHRLASDYFLDATLNGEQFRDVLRREFKIKEVKKDKTYFTYPENWWDIFRTIFKYDPNSLIHGVLFAKEQIKVSRMLTAHMEAFGVQRVGSSGVKFDPLGKTVSGQPIFSVDEETAHKIRATFIIDLALLRSYGKEDKGLNLSQKRLLLELALWKVSSLLSGPFRYRTNCYLQCKGTSLRNEKQSYNDGLPVLDIRAALDTCGFTENNNPLQVYYPASELFKLADEHAAGETVTEKPAEEEDTESSEE